jgi:hypothetical protein
MIPAIRGGASVPTATAGTRNPWSSNSRGAAADGRGCIRLMTSANALFHDTQRGAAQKRQLSPAERMVRPRSLRNNWNRALLVISSLKKIGR